MSIIALWVLVLFETGLLLLLLRALGELRQKGTLASTDRRSLNRGGLAVGEKAPSFVAIDYDDNQISLEGYQGQRRILAFISPGCSACSGAIETLNVFLKKEQGVTVLVLGELNSSRNHAYATEHSAQMPILTPTPGVEEELYRVRALPFVFVIDEVGIIRAKGVVNESEHLQMLLLEAFPHVPVSR